MEDCFVVGRVGVVAVRLPIGGVKMDFHVANREIRFRFAIAGKAKNGAAEIGSARMIPEPRLDHFHRATVIARQLGSKKLLKPKGLNLQLGRQRLLAQGLGRQVVGRGGSGFHARNLIFARLRT
jgi:hypothetical protein